MPLLAEQELPCTTAPEATAADAAALDILALVPDAETCLSSC